MGVCDAWARVGRTLDSDEAEDGRNRVAEADALLHRAAGIDIDHGRCRLTHDRREGELHLDLAFRNNPIPGKGKLLGQNRCGNSERCDDEERFDHGVHIGTLSDMKKAASKC